MALAPYGALTTEFAHQAFTAEHGGNPALAGLGDVKLQRLLKRHNVSGIDNILAVHQDGIDGAK